MKKSFIVLILTTLISFSFADNSFQILSLHPEGPLAKQLKKELNMINAQATLTAIQFPDLVNYSDATIPKASLNFTQISLGVAELITELSIATCIDNNIKLIGGKESGLFVFQAKFDITNAGKTYSGQCIINVNAQNLLISKEFGFENGKPSITAKIHLDFALNDYTANPADTTNFKNILESGLNKFIEISVQPLVNIRLQNDLNDYYSSHYIENLYLNITTLLPQRSYKINANYIENPTSLRDPETQRGGILFKRSGNILGFENNHPAVNFTQFDHNSPSVQIFLSRFIFDDIISNMTAKYAFRGKVVDRNINLLGLPFKLTIKSFSQILPSILDTFSANDQIEVHWSVYDLKLDFDENAQKIKGIARLDSTFFANIDSTDAKQIYSFEVNLNFDIVVDTSERKLNLFLKNVGVDQLKVRENYGFTYYSTIRAWLNQILTKSVEGFPFTLFDKAIDISSFYDRDLSYKLYKNGILVY